MKLRSLGFLAFACSAALSGALPVYAAGESALHFRLTADPVTLDWNLARSSHETYIIMNVMEGLVEERPWDGRTPGEGGGPNVVPALAEKWDLSADGKTYTFELKSGVKWSDGKPLRAQDFVDSWLRLMDPKTKSTYASFLDDIEGAEAYRRGKGSVDKVAVHAPSATRLTFTLSHPVSYFPHLLTFWVTFPIRKDLIAKNGAKWATPGKIATLGPYLLQSWAKGRSIELKKNDAYAGNGKPTIDLVTAVIESNDQRARVLFDEGKLDFLLDATTSDLLRGGASGARVEQFPYLATYYLAFNTKSAALKDAGVRRALGLAIDRDAIPGILQGGQVAAKGFLPPGIEGHGAQNAIRGTLYEARSALAKAGFTEGKGFPRLTLLVEKFDGAEALGEFITRSVREKLGVDLIARVSPPSEFQDATRARKAEIYIGHWGADFPDASNFLDIFMSGSGVTGTQWSNSKYDATLEEAGRTQDGAKRRELYAKAEQILLQEDVVILPLFYRRNAVLLGKRVKKLEISPLNYLFLKTTTLN